MRLRLLALLAAIVVTPAIGQQVMQVQPVQRPLIVPQIQPIQQEPDPASKIMTIEEAKARIAQLNRDKRDLDARLTEALATIDSWTRKGGSLVHAYCESEEISRTSAGASEDCSTSGYRCAPVEGTCRRSCNVTTDCAGYYVCDTAAHVCVHS